MDINHVFDIWSMMHEELYTYGSTNLLIIIIISNQADAPHVSICKSFCGNSSPVYFQKLANLRLGLCVLDETFFTSTMGRIDSGRIVYWGMSTYTCLLFQLMVVPFEAL